MPILNLEPLPYEPEKELAFDWNNFRGGLNTLLRETELEDNELAQAENLILVGSGVPTKRWGTNTYFLSGATGGVRGLKGYYLADGSQELLALTDWGYLTKKSGASYTMLTGASWASGYNAFMAQLDNDIYIVNGQREMVRYSTPTLAGFPTIARPTGVGLTQVSGGSGTNTYSYRVSAVSRVGETLATQSVVINNQPQVGESGFTRGAIACLWTGVSTASGVLAGYNVYGRDLGDERFLASVNAPSTTWIDDGVSIPKEFTYPQTADSTGGIKAKYILRFEDRLVFAGIDGEPSKVVISGRMPHHEKFDISHGGNYIKIEPDAGDDITGLTVFENKIIVFKECSIWQITLSSTQIGNFYVWVPIAQLITGSHGCIAPKSIKYVENDVFFLSRRGVYALGYEPNILNVLRTNEISVKVRPFFDERTTAEIRAATAFYHDFKYGLTFPGTNWTIIYDRERLAWMGPWTFDANIFETYIDDNNDEILLKGEDNSPNVYEVSNDYTTDDGDAIVTILKTKKETFGDWGRFKYLKEAKFAFRDIQGTINVEPLIEKQSGMANVVVNSFNVVEDIGNSGWGADQWGDCQWADSEEHGGIVSVSETVRLAKLNRRGRNLQFNIKTTDANTKYELLGIQARARPLGRITRGTSWTT